MKNENKYKSIEAERFISVISLLIEKEFAKSFKEIAEKSGHSSQDFTDIKSGKKDLQRHFLSDIAKIYPVNEVYVLTGEEEMFKTGEINNSIEEPHRPEYVRKPQSELEYLKSQLELTRELLKEKSKYIDMFQPLIDQALKEMLERNKTK